MKFEYLQAKEFALEYDIRRVQVNQDGLKVDGTHQLLVYDDVYINWAAAHILYTKTQKL